MKDFPNKDSLVFLPIVNYVYHLVNRCGSQPEQLPGELDLCEKFKVARGTVRRAMSRLMERNIVIQLPKRRGYFSNPQFSNHGANIIGVLVANGYIASMAHTSVPLFTGFVKGLHPMHCDFNFLTLASDEPDVLKSLIECTNIDGLLWIAPEDRNIPAIEALLGTGFPMVIVENIYQSNTIHPSSNYLQLDQRNIVTRCVRQIILAGCRAPLYCSDSTIAPKLFQKLLEENHIPFTEDRILAGTVTLAESINVFLNGACVDCIVCDGDIRRYLTILETLQAHPRGKTIQVYLEKGMESEHLLAKFPDLQIRYLDLEDVLVRQAHVGRRAGALMNKLMRKTSSKTFETEFYQ